MNLKNVKYNSYPLIAHNPEHGEREHPLWERILSHHRLSVCSVSDDLTVVTWNNQSSSLLEKQLQKLEVEYICLGKDEPLWNSNRIKVSTLLKSSIKTKYILGMDAYDVVIMRDLRNIVNEFKEMDCDLIYNATSKVYPSCKEHYDIERKMSEGIFGFFNSGVFIGKTQFLMNSLSELNLSEPEFSHSDQFLVRTLYHKYYPRIKVDWKCKIFQIMFLEHGNIESYLQLEPSHKLYV